MQQIHSRLELGLSSKPRAHGRCLRRTRSFHPVSMPLRDWRQVPAPRPRGAVWQWWGGNHGRTKGRQGHTISLHAPGSFTRRWRRLPQAEGMTRPAGLHLRETWASLPPICHGACGAFQDQKEKQETDSVAVQCSGNSCCCTSRGLHPAAHSETPWSGSARREICQGEGSWQKPVNPSAQTSRDPAGPPPALMVGQIKSSALQVDHKKRLKQHSQWDSLPAQAEQFLLQINFCLPPLTGGDWNLALSGRHLGASVWGKGEPQPEHSRAQLGSPRIPLLHSSSQREATQRDKHAPFCSPYQCYQTQIHRLQWKCKWGALKTKTFSWTIISMVFRESIQCDCGGPSDWEIFSAPCKHGFDWQGSMRQALAICLIKLCQ